VTDVCLIPEEDFELEVGALVVHGWMVLVVLVVVVARGLG